MKFESGLARAAGLCCSARGRARSEIQKSGLPAVTELQGQLLNVILVLGKFGHSPDNGVEEQRHADHRQREEGKEVRNLFQNTEKIVARCTHMD